MNNSGCGVIYEIHIKKNFQLVGYSFLVNVNTDLAYMMCTVMYMYMYM